MFVGLVMCMCALFADYYVMVKGVCCHCVVVC